MPEEPTNNGTPTPASQEPAATPAADAGQEPATPPATDVAPVVPRFAAAAGSAGSTTTVVGHGTWFTRVVEHVTVEVRVFVRHVHDFSETAWDRLHGMVETIAAVRHQRESAGSDGETEPDLIPGSEWLQQEFESNPIRADEKQADYLRRIEKKLRKTSKVEQVKKKTIQTQYSLFKKPPPKK